MSDITLKIEENLQKFDFDQIFISDKDFPKIVKIENFIIEKEFAFLEGYNKSLIGYYCYSLNNKKVEVHIDRNLEENNIVFKHFNKKNERKVKLNIIHDGSD